MDKFVFLYNGYGWFLKLDSLEVYGLTHRHTVSAICIYVQGTAFEYHAGHFNILASPQYLKFIPCIGTFYIGK